MKKTRRRLGITRETLRALQLSRVTGGALKGGGTLFGCACGAYDDSDPDKKPPTYKCPTNECESQPATICGCGPTATI